MPDKQASFIELIKEHESIMFHACRTYAFGLERNDMVQDILMQAWIGFHSFKNQSRFSTWFYSVCKRTCLYAVRNRNRFFTVELTNDLAESIHYTDEISNKVQQGMRYTTVMDSLQQDEVDVLYLYMEGVSFKEIERITGLNENFLRVKVHRIKRRLQLRYGR